MEKIIKKIVELMREYQDKNEIRGECVTNVKYLYENMKENTKMIIEVKPVFVVIVDSTYCKIIIHLVIEINEKTEDRFIIDASNDIYKLEKKEYFDNVSDLMYYIKSIPRGAQPSGFSPTNEDWDERIKESIKEFIYFIKIAELIKNDKYEIKDLKYYNDQADYVEQNL